MKALILAAGFGTRLLPYTQKLPKPLFSINGQPLLDIIIKQLINAGCKEILVNSHHLGHMILDFLNQQNYPILVGARHEAEILGTGGAIKNLADFWDKQPFMVINSDILTSIDLAGIYAFHQSHEYPVTMVLHDYKKFNTVTVDSMDFITEFNSDKIKNQTNYNQQLAFTGIHVIDPSVLDLIPPKRFCSIIDVYREMIIKGLKIKAVTVLNHYWKDIGSLSDYVAAVFDSMAPKAFKRAFDLSVKSKDIRCQKLKGDGSDRTWNRLTVNKNSLILAGHGLEPENILCEASAFADIGNHLAARKVKVPQIHLSDRFSGLVFIEDLGDTNLQTLVLKAKNHNQLIEVYRKVIQNLICLAVRAYSGFDLSWTYQTRAYNADLIIEKEGRYFVEAFLISYLDLKTDFQHYEKDIILLAEKIEKNAINGLIHRDMQSRNIMLKDNDFYFIDFQGARQGPIQYDLASLLIDPYVGLPLSIQTQLKNYYIKELAKIIKFDKNCFLSGYKYCSIARNLQILGAFGFLTRVKNKIFFEKYISPALGTLKQNLDNTSENEFLQLKALISSISKRG